MRPSFDDVLTRRARWAVIEGDAAARLRDLPDASVQCIVTSPPYFGLRDYGVEGQIGLEATPEEYVARLVDVFREARRVLADDGVAWVNLGDAYAGSWGAQGRPGGSLGVRQAQAAPLAGRGVVPPGLQRKELIGLPWMFAFAMRAAAWRVRAEVIWAKPSPMPESVTDRPTKAHEPVLLFTKSERYRYDAAAIAEPAVTPPEAQAARRPVPSGKGRSGNGVKPQLGGALTITGTRNARSVWTIPSEPSDLPHHAMMPSELARRCVLAGSRVGDVVLDPFTGSGTTGLVAIGQRRRFVGIDLSPVYADLAGSRLAQDAPMLDLIARRNAS